jgi:hypothetical protein
VIRLDEPTWRARAAAHTARVEAWVAPHLDRRQHAVAHPVEDFLFTYYSYRPAQLRRWHPGAGVFLAGAEPGPGYVAVDGGATLDVDALLARRGDSVAWIADLLRRTASRPAQLGCFGLHEWAMVYRQSPDEVRHNAYPLRLDPARVVEQARIRCSHFDAYRFFTEAARPLNVIQPTRHSQPEYEQPGCLHANMDLYKWAYKLSPLVPSELLADCFELAMQIRVLDMRASPYDLTGLGLTPVPIETPDGRTEYARQQREFADRAAELRTRLLGLLETVLSGWSAGQLDQQDQDDQPRDPAADQPDAELPVPPAEAQTAVDHAGQPHQRLAAEEDTGHRGEVLQAATGRLDHLAGDEGGQHDHDMAEHGVERAPAYPGGIHRGWFGHGPHAS